MSPTLQIFLALDATKFAAGAQKAQASMNSLVAGLGSRLSGFMSIDFLVSKVMQTLRLADDIGDLAAKLGVSTDQVQEFGYAARKTGASVESFTSALRTLITAQQDALGKGESSEAFKPFATLGLSFAELKRLAPEQLLYRVGDAFRDSSQSGQQLDAVISLLGRGSMDLMGALKEGLRDLGKEAHATGQVMSAELVGNLGRANDELENMGRHATVDMAKGLGVFWKFRTGRKAMTAFWYSFFYAVFNQKSINEAWRLAQESYKGVFNEMMPGSVPRKKGAPLGTEPPSMWDRIGDPGEVQSWKTYSIGEERRTPLTFGSADALARIGLFRGGYDPGERTRLQQLTELRALNRAVAQTNRLLEAEL